jgi:hypothetical protein
MYKKQFPKNRVLTFTYYHKATIYFQTTYIFFFFWWQFISVKHFTFISYRNVSSVKCGYEKGRFVFLVPTVSKYLTYSLLHMWDRSSLCTGDTPVSCLSGRHKLSFSSFVDHIDHKFLSSEGSPQLCVDMTLWAPGFFKCCPWTHGSYEGWNLFFASLVSLAALLIRSNTRAAHLNLFYHKTLP